jgi:ferritin-like metal-binding protein YciE
MSTTSERKILQYLEEAHASETALVRVLQSQIAVTPHGGYRDLLERHLKQTRGHAERLERRRGQLGHHADPFTAAVGLFETMVGQALALSKTPLDLLRGSGGEEKVLKNAKDTCATEALEIATYRAIERLARALGDAETADLAASIRAEEERMLDRVLAEIPKLAEAVARADVGGEGSYDVATTGAGEAARGTAKAATRPARRTATRTKRTAQARKVPGAARAAGAAKGAVAGADDLPIAGYDDQAADQIAARLPELSQVDLAKVAVYERRHEDRATVLGRIETLQASEPWPGYDELTVDEVRAALTAADDERARAVRDYERAHKDRAGVISATEREVANA